MIFITDEKYFIEAPCWVFHSMSPAANVVVVVLVVVTIVVIIVVAVVVYVVHVAVGHSCSCCRSSYCPCCKAVASRLTYDEIVIRNRVFNATGWPSCICRLNIIGIVKMLHLNPFCLMCCEINAATWFLDLTLKVSSDSLRSLPLKCQNYQS